MMKLIKTTKYGLVGLLFIMPVIALAIPTLGSIETAVLDLLNLIIPVLIAAAIVFFLWGVLKYVNSGDNAEERVQARALMTYGIIAIFVMVSLWGLIGLLRNVFDLNDPIVMPVNFDDIILEL